MKDIIAADAYSAVFLSAYLRHSALHKKYVPFLEVIDLQKYKLITQPAKIRQALNGARQTPFVFVVGKN